MLALDAAMGIFNNVPPRINYCELDLQLSCHSESFEVANYGEMLQRAALPRPRMKIIEAFQKLFVHPSELKTAYQHEVLCCWDMLSLIHGTCNKYLAPWVSNPLIAPQSFLPIVGNTSLEIHCNESRPLP